MDSAWCVVAWHLGLFRRSVVRVLSFTGVCVSSDGIWARQGFAGCRQRAWNLGVGACCRVGGSFLCGGCNPRFPARLASCCPAFDCRGQGEIAEEVGADKRITKTATLLHDIGKAVTHKIEGKHAEIGAELAKKYGMPDEVVHAIAAHHDDIEPTTPEAIIVKIVDAISAARPGARNISAENFAERMKDLENIATSFPGIDKAYAISAGREIRVIVEPKSIDDLSALKLARDIADKIEATMSYPGVIKVNVIRETRAVEYAK